jgi:hypothetical protein
VEINGACSIKNVSTKTHVKATRKTIEQSLANFALIQVCKKFCLSSCNRWVQRRFASFEARAFSRVDQVRRKLESGPQFEVSLGVNLRFFVDYNT